MAGKIEAAWSAYEKGDIEVATSMFGELTSNGVHSTHPFIQKGLFLLRLDKFAEARESFERASEIDPTNPAPLFFSALAQELSGDSESTLTTLEKLKEKAPHHQGISSLELLQRLRSGDPLRQLSDFGFGPPSTQRKVSIGRRLAAGLGLGDPSWLPSDLSSSSYLLGPILIEIEEKLHPLEVRSLEHHPALLPDNLDEMKPQKRGYREELSQITNSLRAGPILKKGKSAFERSYGLSDREQQRTLLHQAARHLRLARKIDPFAFRVSYHLGETYIFLARGRPGEPYSRFRLLQAQNCFLESARKEGINPYLLFYLAYIQHLLGRPKLAIRYYQEATKKFEKLPEAHYGEGQCELLLGNKQRAKELMLKAVNSDLALARERLDLFANLLAEHGLEHFNQAIPEMPAEPIESTERVEASVGETGSSEPDSPKVVTESEATDGSVDQNTDDADSDNS
jgi:tetratricopeptide (TPR) repeat protein